MRGVVAAALALAAAAGAGGCLLCEPGAARALGALVGPYLARALPRQPELRARVAALLRSGLRGLAALPRHPAAFMGVIDENTLHEASTHFRRTVGRVMEQNYQDERVFNELYWMLQEVKDHFEQLMRRFQSEAFCPNNCGRMEQVWIDCWSCNTSLFSCMRGLLCGERRLSVAEDEDLILDCGLAWHRAAHGTKTYIFYRAAPPGEQRLVSGPDAFLVRKQVTGNESGRYRCEMRNPRGELCSELRFTVTVTAAEPRWRPPAPPPPRRPAPARAAAAAAASGFAAVAAAAAAWACLRRRGDSGDGGTPPDPPPQQ